MMKINLLILFLMNGIISAQNNISKLYTRADSQSFFVQRIVPMKDGGFAFNDGGGLMIKNDSNGNLMWSKKYSLPVGFSIESVNPTLDGGLITSGIIFNMPESFYFKVNSNGNLVWAKRSSLSNPFFCTSPNNGLNIRTAIQTPDSGYVLLYEVRNIGTSAKCVIVDKIDKTGFKLWTKNFTIPGIRSPFMSINNIGEIYVYGLYELVNSNNQAAYILKINSMGNLVWSKRILGDNLRKIELLATTSGSIITLIDKKNNNTFNYGILKLSALGSLKWQKFSNTDFYSAIEDANNNFIFGKSNGIVKLDSNGNLNWSRSLTASGIIVFSKKFDCLIAINDLQIAIPKSVQLLNINENGTSSACIGFDTISFLSDSIQLLNHTVTLNTLNIVQDTTYTGINSSNVSINIANGCIVSSVDGKTSNLKIYFSVSPNPSDGVVEIKNNEGLGFSIEIFDPLGHQVYFKKNNTSHEQLDLRALSKGLYFYRFKTKTGSQYTNKLAIE